MHDPMVVAHEIRRPWPQRSKHHDTKPGGRRWRIERSPFWTLFGKGYYWPGLVTIWHVEPDGHDSGSICKHWRKPEDVSPYEVLLNPCLKFIPANPEPGFNTRDSILDTRWKWHVHHWKIQISPLQKLKRLLFERCIECGLRYPWGYAPVSHSWDGPRGKWFKVDRVNYHHECSSLSRLRGVRAEDEILLKQLAARVRIAADISELELIEQIKSAQTNLEDRNQQWRIGYRLQKLLGWDLDDSDRWVKV